MTQESKSGKAGKLDKDSKLGKLAQRSSGWSDRITYARDPDGGFFYRPRQVIARDAPGGVSVEDRLKALLAARHLGEPSRILEFDDNYLISLPERADVLRVVADLKDDGFRAEPNYVLFAHTVSGNPLYGNPLYGNPLYGNPLYGNPLYGNPLYGNPLYGNPLYGNPLYGNPLYGNPLYGNPLYGNPLYGNPLGYQYKATGRRLNSAQPAPVKKATKWTGSRGKPTVFVFDSGLAEYVSGTAKPNQLPDLLSQGVNRKGWGALNPNKMPYPYVATNGIDVPDSQPDKALDPVAGHGTFIAGVIELLAPGHDVNVIQLFEIEGDVDVAKVCWCLEHETAGSDDQTLINLSFAGYAPEEMFALARTIRNVQAKGAVVVASAGNDATWRPAYPACLPNVVSVGALSPFGPAQFTNYGPWVRACAPGTEILSTFYQNFDGPLPGPSTVIDPDRFEGWARWSGTSFAAPVVVAALAREMDRARVATGNPCTGTDAVKAVIDAPGLLRIPGLGTVVNIAWPPADD